MAREIWKISKFDGGLNNHKNPKDLKSNEFAELVDCNISQDGIIKPLGQALKSTSQIPETQISEDLNPGYGFYRYFSDYTFAPAADAHVTATVATTQEGGLGDPPFMIFRPTNCIWAFEGALGGYDTTGNKPSYATTIKLELRVNGVPIHAEEDGTGSTGLTVIAAPNANGGFDGTHANVTDVFKSKTYKHYDRFVFPFTISGAVPTEFHAYPGLLRNRYHSSWDSDYLLGSSDTRSYLGREPGKGFEKLAFKDFVGPNDSYDDQGFTFFNSPDTWLPFRDDINAQIYNGNYWHGFDDMNYGNDYWWNDHRLIFGYIPDFGNLTSTAVDGATVNFQDYEDPYWVLGFSQFDGYDTTYQESTVFPDFTPIDDLWGPYDFQLQLSESQVSFPLTDWFEVLHFQDTDRYPLSRRYWSDMAIQGLAHKLIKAINNYRAGGASATGSAVNNTSTLNNFTAEFLDYRYEKGLTAHSEVTGYNDEREYTNNPLDFIKLTLNTDPGGTGTPTLAVGTSTLLNARLTAEFAVNTTDGTHITPRKQIDIFRAGGFQRSNRVPTQINHDVGIITADVSATSNVILVNESTAAFLHPGEMIRIDDEHMIITSIMKVSDSQSQTNTDGSTTYVPMYECSVIRGAAKATTGSAYAATTAATHDARDHIIKYAIHPLSNLDSKSRWWSTPAFNNFVEGCRDYGTGWVHNGDPIFRGQSAGGLPKIITITFNGSGYASGDILNLRIFGTYIGDDLSNQEVTHTFNGSSWSNTIDTLFASVNGIWSSKITAARSGQTMTITSGTAGLDGNFFVETLIIQNDHSIGGIVTQGVSEELSILLHRSADVIHGEQWAHSSLMYLEDESGSEAAKRTDLKLHSKLQGNWVNVFGGELEWYWAEVTSGSTEYYNRPLLWDEGSRLRVVETNFKLYNDSKCVDYFDVRGWFVNALKSDSTYYLDGGINDASFVRVGHIIHNNDKKWTYSNTSTAEDGLDTDGTNNHTTTTAEFTTNARMVCHFDKYTSGSDGVDWVGTAKFYAAAIYDDGGESLPAHKFNSELTFGVTDGVNDNDTLRFRCGFRPWGLEGNMVFEDRRIIGIHIYYTHSEEGFETFWSLGRLLWKQGFVPANTISSVDASDTGDISVLWQDNDAVDNVCLKLYDANNDVDYYEFISMPKLDTYESVNGYSPFASTTSVRYKAHCLAGRRSFVGNIGVKESPNSEELTYYNDAMAISPVNQLDTFPWPANRLDLDISDGDEITALVSVGDKVLQFKRNIMYVINVSTSIPSEFFVEGRHKYRGVLNSNHIVEIGDGVFFVNENGAFLFNGTDIENLHFEEGEAKQNRKIALDIWRDFISANSMVGFNQSSDEIIIVRSNNQSNINDGDCWVYNLSIKAWTFGEGKYYVGDDKILTNFSNIGDDGNLAVLYNGAVGQNNTADGGPG